jgi:hypothetical protein
MIGYTYLIGCSKCKHVFSRGGSQAAHKSFIHGLSLRSGNPHSRTVSPKHSSRHGTNVSCRITPVSNSVGPRDTRRRIGGMAALYSLPKKSKANYGRGHARKFFIYLHHNCMLLHL